MRQFRFLLASLLFQTAATALCGSAYAVPTLSAISAKELTAKVSKSGHPTIVNLWATWCGPCKEEMPELIEVRAEHPGVELMLITGDTETDLKEAAEFLAKLGVEFPVYRLSEAPDVFMAPFIKDWAAVVPTTILFDAEGKRAQTFIGRVKKKDLEKKLGELARIKPGSKHASLASPAIIGSH
jgi:thiol-disulfide isomerase/thioredoxin